MPRPCKIDKVWFKRRIGNAERKILMAAGQGDLSLGWHHLLETYQNLWERGYRPTGDLNDFLVPVYPKELKSATDSSGAK